MGTRYSVNKFFLKTMLDFGSRPVRFSKLHFCPIQTNKEKINQIFFFRFCFKLLQKIYNFFVDYHLY